MMGIRFGFLRSGGGGLRYGEWMGGILNYLPMIRWMGWDLGKMELSGVCFLGRPFEGGLGYGR